MNTTRKPAMAAVVILLVALLAVVLVGVVVPGGTSPAKADEAVVLTVWHGSNVIKTYTLTQLKALPAYSGFAGFVTSGNSIHGPDPIQGVEVDVVLQDALGTALTDGQSADIRAGSDSYTASLSYNQIVNGTPFPMFNATTGAAEAAKDTVSCVLVYSRNGGPLDADEGNLRLYAAQPSDQHQVMEGSTSVYAVTGLTVRDQALTEWNLKLVGLRVNGKRQVVTKPRNEVQQCANPFCHGSNVKAESQLWTGVPLWRLIGVVDGGKSHYGHSYNDALARSGYRIRLTGSNGRTAIISSRVATRRNSVVIAYKVGGAVLGAKYYPLRLVGPTKYVPSTKYLGKLTKIEMLPK